MSSAAEVLDRLGRPSALRLGAGGLQADRRFGTGLVSVDDLLNGGLPRGRITELSGRPSVGRTAFAVHAVATATLRGETVAWIDPADRLEPDALAEAGTRLARVLWVRPVAPADALRAADLLLRTGGFGLIVLDLDGTSTARAAGAWSRLRQAVEQSRGVLLAWSAARIVDSGAALVLELTADRVRWRRGAGRRVMLDGVDAHLTVLRSRQSRAGACARLSWRTAA